jgi:uncharacterized protein
MGAGIARPAWTLRENPAAPAAADVNCRPSRFDDDAESIVSSTLREQLLKAGLVTEKQVKASEQQQQRPANRPNRHKPPPPPSPQKIAAEKAAAAKAARDAALNKQRQEAVAAKARAMEIKQLIEANKLPKPLQSEDRFNFIAGKKLRFILVDPAMREGLNQGSLFIIRYDGKSEVVPAAIADRIRERDARAVVNLNAAESAPVDENDPYKDFVVPDDLKW